MGEAHTNLNHIMFEALSRTGLSVHDFRVWATLVPNMVTEMASSGIDVRDGVCELQRGCQKDQS